MTSSETTSPLNGLRVLVVEDSFLIALSLRKMLSDLGCVVLGPVASVDEAMKLLQSSSCDAGVLDINLGAETSIPVAEALRDKGRPFVFVTGYSSPVLHEVKFSTYRRLRKPFNESVLRAALLQEFGKPAGAN